MNLFGESLEAVFEAGGRSSLPAERVCATGIGLLRALRDTHAAGLVHRDLKPENFLVGGAAAPSAAGGDKGAPPAPDAPDVFLVDFGLSAPFSRERARKDADGPPTTLRNIVGTSRYAPIAAHYGRAQLPADDIEAVLYCLAYLARADRLPWQGLRLRDKKARNSAVASIKLSTSTDALCASCSYLLPFATLARSGADPPDYDRLIELLRAAAAALHD